MKKNKGHENMRPAKKGEVRNPKGRPKGSLNTKTIMQMIMAAKVDKSVAEKVSKYMSPFGSKGQLTVQQIANMQQASKAMAGDLAALKYCQAALGEPVVETVKVQGDKDNPITQVTPLMVEITTKGS